MPGVWLVLVSTGLLFNVESVVIRGLECMLTLWTCGNAECTARCIPSKLGHLNFGHKMITPLTSTTLLGCPPSHNNL